MVRQTDQMKPIRAASSATTTRGIACDNNDPNDDDHDNNGPLWLCLSWLADSTMASAGPSSSALALQRKNNEHQQVYTRQATILRKNLMDWDRMLHDPRGEDWPTMLGRLSAAQVRSCCLDSQLSGWVVLHTLCRIYLYVYCC